MMGTPIYALWKSKKEKKKNGTGRRFKEMKIDTSQIWGRKWTDIVMDAEKSHQGSTMLWKVKENMVEKNDLSYTTECP